MTEVSHTVWRQNFTHSGQILLDIWNCSPIPGSPDKMSNNFNVPENHNEESFLYRTWTWKEKKLSKQTVQMSVEVDQADENQAERVGGGVAIRFRYFNWYGLPRYALHPTYQTNSDPC